MSTTTNVQRGDHRHPEATGAAHTSTFGHGAAARLIRRTSVIALAGTLALASVPTSALAAQSQQAPQEALQGDSDVTVTCDSYSTDYDASEVGTLSDDLIDRSDFDEQMGTSTTWSMGDQGSTTQASATQASSAQATTSTQVQAEASSETSENPIIAFFQWLGSLLGF